MGFLKIKIGRNYKKSFKFWQCGIALPGHLQLKSQKIIIITNEYLLPSPGVNLLPDAASA